MDAGKDLAEPCWKESGSQAGEGTARGVGGVGTRTGQERRRLDCGSPEVRGGVGWEGAALDLACRGHRGRRPAVARQRLPRPRSTKLVMVLAALED